MGSFPHAQVPSSLRTDPREAQFFEDMRKILSALQILGNDVIVRAGNGSPEGVVTANQGSLFLRLDGSVNTSLYVKTSGQASTGWTAK